ncbi:MAG: hypothetical protein WD929_10720 [Steroidobacteraceae bacterium]
MSMMAKTVYEGEVFPHRQLWLAARVMRQRSEADRDGALYLDMAAMLLARLTVEAYCNFAIHVLDVDTFDNERQIFGGSTDAKLQWICDRVGMPLDRGRRPFQTIHSLDELRDLMVHAKPEIFVGENLHPADEEPPFMRPGELERRATPALRDQALEDVEQICEQMHQRILGVSNREQVRRLHPYALTGTSQWQSRVTSLA